jgi:hypothetical protein
MNKAIHYFVILSMLFCPYSPAHAADPAAATSAAVQKSISENTTLYQTQNSTRYDPDNPSYYNSLRWLVYALILFLPFSPPGTPPQPGSPFQNRIRGTGNSYE